MNFSAVIVAAGSGERAGPGEAKQWRMIGGKTVALWSLEAFLAAGAQEIVVVIPSGHEDRAATAFGRMPNWTTTPGGATRAQSTLAGLRALAKGHPRIVLIHDAARPLLTRATIEALVAALANTPGAVPALPMSDTLKRLEPGTDMVSTAPRDGLWRAQTPQAFRFDEIVRAYEVWPDGETPTDDAQVMERAGGAITLTPGDPTLIKLTYPEDFAMAEMLAGAARVTRIGQGFDAHRFGPGSEIWLCGVKIPHTHGLIGHSDADAGLHALTDALLGAIGAGDIGDHFPPGDPKWKGAPSSVFLSHAAKLVAAHGASLINADVTLICERPKIKPHREAMRTRIAELLGLPVDAVSVKATTTETMGFTGREEGLAAQAVASIETPR